MRIRCTIMAAALVLALSGVAQAGTLYTPPLWPGPANELACSVANVGKKPREVKVEMFEYSGILVPSAFNMTLQTGQTGWARTQDDFARICKFTFSGSKKNIRASACIVANGDCISALPAYRHPARHRLPVATGKPHEAAPP